MNPNYSLYIFCQVWNSATDIIILPLFSRHEINLNRSNSQLHGSRNGNLDKNLDFLDSGTPPSPPGSRKTSYTREYVRNLPTTVSGHSAPATRGRLTRRSTTLRDSSRYPNAFFLCYIKNIRISMACALFESWKILHEPNSHDWNQFYLDFYSSIYSSYQDLKNFL